MSDAPPKQPVTGTDSVRMDTGAGLPPYQGANTIPDPVPVTPASHGADAGMSASAALVSMHNAAAAGDAFPVLKAFQDYLESERQRARRRMTTLSVVFAIVTVAVIGAFAMIWFSTMKGMQDTNRQLLDAALKRANAEPPAPVVVQPPPQPSAAETAKVIAEAVSRAQSEQSAVFAKTLEGLNASLETMRQDNAAMKAQIAQAEAAAAKAEAARLAAEKAAAAKAAAEKAAAEKAAAQKAAAEKAAAEKAAAERAKAEKAARLAAEKAAASGGPGFVPAAAASGGPGFVPAAASGGPGFVPATASGAPGFVPAAAASGGPGFVPAAAAPGGASATQAAASGGPGFVPAATASGGSTAPAASATPPPELVIPKYDAPPPPAGFSQDTMAVRLPKEPRPISWRVYIPQRAEP